jgi:hypothetical protein
MADKQPGTTKKPKDDDTCKDTKPVCGGGGTGGQGGSGGTGGGGQGGGGGGHGGGKG